MPNPTRKVTSDQFNKPVGATSMSAELKERMVLICGDCISYVEPLSRFDDCGSPVEVVIGQPDCHLLRPVQPAEDKLHDTRVIDGKAAGDLD